MDSEWRTEPTESMPTDLVFDLLGHRYRRRLVACLRVHDEPVPLGVVAEEVAAWELDGEADEPPEDAVEHVRTELYHWHVPKLRGHGVVEFDREEEIVGLDDRAEALSPHLEMVVEGGPGD